MMTLKTVTIVKNRLTMYSKKTIKKLKDYFAKHDQKSNSIKPKNDSDKPQTGKDIKGGKR